MSEPRTTDYCLRCGESPDSGTHLFGHTYEDPRMAPSRRVHPHTLVPSMSDKLDPLGFLDDETPRPGPPPTYPTFVVKGRVRLYFNRKEDAPRVWCISDAARNWELCLSSVEVDVPLLTVYDHAGRKAYEGVRQGDAPPVAYFLSVHEVLVTVTGDRAVVSRLP